MSHFIHRRGPILVCMLILLCMHFVLPTTATSVNITVDDTFGNDDKTVIPAYLPADDTWHVGSPSEACDACGITPSMLNMGQIVDQSWHHGTYFVGTPIQVTISFPGTAVYVYNVLPNSVGETDTNANISFMLDGETVGHFVHHPDSSSDFLYNQLVYANSSLSDSLHTLVMSASGSGISLIFFDYLLYTTEVQDTASPTTPATFDTTYPATNPSSSSSATTTSASSLATTTSTPSSHHPPTATVVGGVVGGFTVLIVGAVLCFIPCRRRRRRSQRHSFPPAELEADSESYLTSASIFAPSTRISTSEPSSRPVSIGPLSNAATIADTSPSLECAATVPSSAWPSRHFEAKREAAVRRKVDALYDQAQPKRGAIRSSQRLWRNSELRLESDLSEGLSTGVVQELQGEIAALRGVLSMMAASVGPVHALVGLDNRMVSEVLPEYEEAHRGMYIDP